jgi:hypothetical protein
MGRFDVLASWGHPDRRVRDSTDQEEWTYTDVDQDSGDALVYGLVFRSGVLERWSTRSLKNTGLAYRGGKTEEQTKIVPSEPPGGKRVPKN